MSNIAPVTAPLTDEQKAALDTMIAWVSRRHRVFPQGAPQIHEGDIVLKIAVDFTMEWWVWCPETSSWDR